MQYSASACGESSRRCSRAVEKPAYLSTKDTKEKTKGYGNDSNSSECLRVISCPSGIIFSFNSLPNGQRERESIQVRSSIRIFMSEENVDARESPALCSSGRHQNRPPCETSRMRRVHQVRLAMGSSSDVSGMRCDVVLRQFTQSPCEQTCPGKRTSRDRLGRARRTMVVLLSR